MPSGCCAQPRRVHGGSEENQHRARQQSGTTGQPTPHRHHRRQGRRSAAAPNRIPADCGGTQAVRGQSRGGLQDRPMLISRSDRQVAATFSTSGLGAERWRLAGQGSEPAPPCLAHLESAEAEPGGSRRCGGCWTASPRRTGPTRSTCPPRRSRWPTTARTGGRDPAADPPGPPRRQRRAGVGGSAGAVARLRRRADDRVGVPRRGESGGDAAQVGPGPAGPSASRRCQGCSAAVDARSAGCQRSSDSAWVTLWASNSAGSKSAASLSPSHSSLSSWPGWVGSVMAWASSA